jgi:hypothetical protein
MAGEASEQYRAFFWSASSGFKAIGSLDGPNGISLATSINDAGEVRGLSEGPSTVWNGPMGVGLYDTFVWTEASGIRSANGDNKSPDLTRSPRNLTLPAGADCSQIISVNDNGQVLGYAGTEKVSTNPRDRDSIGDCIPRSALLWGADGRFVEIGSCGPRSECSLELSAMNNRGEVVGYASSLGSFRWTASNGFVRIPMENAGVSLINDNGDAAGTVTIGAVTSPLIWKSSGELRTIELPPGAGSGYPIAINASLQVAGELRQ